MSWFLLVFAIILSGIGIIVTGIITIINLASGKKRGAAIGGSVLFFCLLLGGYCGLALTNKVQEKVEKGKDWFADIKAENDDRQAERDALIELIRSYTPAELHDSIPDDWFIEDGFRDWWRIPMRYPYSIEMIDWNDFGHLKNEQGSAHEFMYNLTEIAFDAQYLLAKKDNYGYDMEEADDYSEPPFTFILYSFDNGEMSTFTNVEDLYTAAAEAGYEGELTLHDLDYWYYKIF